MFSRLSRYRRANLDTTDLSILHLAKCSIPGRAVLWTAVAGSMQDEVN